SDRDPAAGAAARGDRRLSRAPEPASERDQRGSARPRGLDGLPGRSAAPGPGAVSLRPPAHGRDRDPRRGRSSALRGRTGRLESPHRGRQTAHMGRIFETRKATMFARWDKMSKAFARIGKEITIAVKAGGPNPDNNPSLRRIMQNARALNMPK